MISFYPGPSKIYSQIKDFMLEVCDSGILSLSHRSAEFVNLSKETIGILKEKLDIPNTYSVFIPALQLNAGKLLVSHL